MDEEVRNLIDTAAALSHNSEFVEDIDLALNGELWDIGWVGSSRLNYGISIEKGPGIDATIWRNGIWEYFHSEGTTNNRSNLKPKSWPNYGQTH